MRHILCAFFLVLSLFCISTTLKAEILHALIVADTTDNAIGSTTKKDIKVMRTELLKIANFTQMQLKLTILSGKNVNSNNVIATIDNLHPDKNDTVFFYFSGHGFHRESERGSRWPDLYFNYVDEGLPLIEVAEKIIQKKPRLTILMSDSCNNFLEEDEIPQMVVRKAINLPAQTSLIKDAYKKLFLRTKGVIFVVGALEGGYAEATNDGGIFTRVFFNTLVSKSRLGELLSWEEFLANVRNRLIDEGLDPIDFLINYEF